MIKKPNKQKLINENYFILKKYQYILKTIK